MFQHRDKNKTASRRPHTCQTNHTHTVPRRKRPIYFWLLQYNKVYISERKTATASSLLECLTRAKPLTSDQKGKTQFILAFLQVQTAKYISERKTATASRMSHTCQTSHSHKEDPKHKILVLHHNIFTAKFRYHVFISFRLKYPYEQGYNYCFRTGTKTRRLLEGLTRARLSTATQCLEGKDQFIFGFCSTKKYTFQRGKQPQLLAFQKASHVPNHFQPHTHAR